MSKKYLIIFYFLVAIYLMPNATIAQDESFFFHYPLHVGDYWDYILYPVTEFPRRVVGDTLMPDGKHYFIVEEVEYGFKRQYYQRVDEDGNLYEYHDRLKFKLDLKKNDSWWNEYKYMIYKVTEMGDTTLWSKRLKYAKIVTVGSTPLPEEFILVDSIGVFFEAHEMWEIDLQGAIINGKQYGTISSVEDKKEGGSPLSFSGNYPNPFNNTTTIAYQLNRSARVRISLFNIRGEKVNTLVNALQPSGSHCSRWNGQNENGQLVSSGIYFYTIEIDGRALFKKAVLYLK